MLLFTCGMLEGVSTVVFGNGDNVFSLVLCVYLKVECRVHTYSTLSCKLL